MIKRNILLAIAALTVSCSAGAQLSSDVVRSEIARNPAASYIDGLNGTLKWNYTTGLELKSFLDVSSEGEVLKYVDDWYDAIIAEDGTIGGKYKKSNYSLDHICPGRTLFQLYDITGKPKYKKAMDALYGQLLEQPRTPEGGFWHKKVYPNQMWLDGLYMAQPFYAEYTERYVTDPAERERNFADIADQFSLVWEQTYDDATGLLRHAWDSSHEMFWCDKETGRSAHAWGRALGWYVMALVDAIPHMPEGPYRDQLTDLLQTVLEAIQPYADPATGMWYQVLDQPGREGNYVEATCSAMFCYGMLWAARNGLGISTELARSKYEGMLKTFVTRDANGLVDLNRCCEVAGLGGKTNRSGTYEYYVGESIRSNDPKGIGPLVWAALEYEKL